MKLADLRKLAIRRQTQIRFPLRNGLECVVTEHGIAQVPGIRGAPAFNLEEELAAAGSFVLDPVDVGKKGQAARPYSIGRDELAGLASAGGLPEAPGHDEE